MRLVLLGTIVSSVAAAPPPAFPQPSDTTGDPGRVMVWLTTRASTSAFAPDAELLLLSLMNQYRAAHSLARLTMDAVLRNLARQHSRSMALNGFVGHGSPLGDSFLERVSAARPGTLVGENVAIVQNAAQAHRVFVASSAHLKNLLAPEFHSVGIGVATADTLGLAVTEIFAH